MSVAGVFLVAGLLILFGGAVPAYALGRASNAGPIEGYVPPFVLFLAACGAFFIAELASLVA